MTHASLIVVRERPVTVECPHPCVSKICGVEFKSKKWDEEGGSEFES